MATKTITVTVKAYNTLKLAKKEKESFSETILRVSGRKPLSSFFGCVSKETGNKMEKIINEMRKEDNKAYEKRSKEIEEVF